MFWRRKFYVNLTLLKQLFLVFIYRFKLPSLKSTYTLDPYWHYKVNAKIWVGVNMPQGHNKQIMFPFVQKKCSKLYKRVSEHIGYWFTPLIPVFETKEWETWEPNILRNQCVTLSGKKSILQVFPLTPSSIHTCFLMMTIQLPKADEMINKTCKRRVRMKNLYDWTHSICYVYI